MDTKRFRPWLAPLLALTLAALACGGGTPAEPTATPFPKPTPRPAATATKEQPTEPAATEAPQATDTPEPAATGAPQAPFTLSAEPYGHASGAFSVSLPEGWEVKDYDDGVGAFSPDKIASLVVFFTNVGVELKDKTLDTYIDAIEANDFGSYKDYKQESREPQTDGSILVVKTLQLDDGTPQTVLSYYWPLGTVVYQEDFWVDTDQYDAYADGLLEVANSLKTDDQAGAQAPLYQYTKSFTGPKNLYQFDVPYGWTYAYNESSDKTATSDTFTTPDSHAVIQALVYDDGTPISRSNAGKVALLLLKSIYGFKDIHVASDKFDQATQRERLTWTDTTLNVTGESFFESRNGTTFIMVSFVSDNDFTGLYVPVWEKLLSTWTTPE